MVEFDAITMILMFSAFVIGMIVYSRFLGLKIIHDLPRGAKRGKRSIWKKIFRR